MLWDTGRDTDLCQKKSTDYDQTVSEGAYGKQSLFGPGSARGLSSGHIIEQSHAHSSMVFVKKQDHSLLFLASGGHRQSLAYRWTPSNFVFLSHGILPVSFFTGPSFLYVSLCPNFSLLRTPVFRLGTTLI